MIETSNIEFLPSKDESCIRWNDDTFFCEPEQFVIVRLAISIPILFVLQGHACLKQAGRNWF